MRTTIALTANDSHESIDAADTDATREPLAERARKQARARSAEAQRNVKRLAGGLDRRRRLVRVARTVLVLTTLLVGGYLLVRFERYRVPNNYTAMSATVNPGATLIVDLGHARLPILAPPIQVGDLVTHDIELNVDGAPRRYRIVGRVLGVPGQRLGVTPVLSRETGLVTAWQFTVDGTAADGLMVPRGYDPRPAPPRAVPDPAADTYPDSNARASADSNTRAGADSDARASTAATAPGGATDIPAGYYFVLTDDAAAGLAQVLCGEPVSDDDRARRDASATFDSRRLGLIAEAAIHARVATTWDAAQPLPADPDEDPEAYPEDAEDAGR